MRVVWAVLLAAVFASCGGRSFGLKGDASSDAAEPVPFTPFVPLPLSPPIPPATGAAGATGGSGGAGGMATGPGAGGMFGIAGTFGAGGMAGAGPPPPGQAGQGGPPDFDAGVLPPPPPPFCTGMPPRSLPYPIDVDFNGRLVLHPDSWTVVDVPHCNQTFFPDALPSEPLDPSAPAPSEPLATAVICSAFKYDPDVCFQQSGGFGGAGLSLCWAGVIFTPGPLGSMERGICIQPGATTVHFKARASKNNARVKFGSIREGLLSTEFFLTLTTVWRSYTITIPAGEDYNNGAGPGGVWNAFSIIAEPQDHTGGTYIFVADVIWALD